VDRAALFPTVVELFQDWGLMLEEDYVLCSWGGTDKRLLLQDCQLHDIEDDWVHSHINIKHQYMELKRLRRPRGLKASVEAEGFDFTGPQHRALADAQNLAKIFVKYLDVWQF
jgi:inhibitor of KinA sporulation pathway (predicted exonuclease)